MLYTLKSIIEHSNVVFVHLTAQAQEVPPQGVVQQTLPPVHGLAEHSSAHIPTVSPDVVGHIPTGAVH